MTSPRWLVLVSTLLYITIPAWDAVANPTESETNLCPESLGLPAAPALQRVKLHRIAAGETVETIAQQYNLKPETLMGMNPALRNNQTPVGTEIKIPPYDGIEVRVEPGQSWNELAEIYKVSGETLFDNNGCLVSPPEVIFVPGVVWAATSPTGASGSLVPLPNSNENVTPGYPLPIPAEVILGYGNTRLDETTAAPSFHSGIDYRAPVGTAVLAADDGVVAFAGPRGAYGNLIVINHSGGKQTRYGHLALIAVSVGQPVKQGEQIGTVGYTGYPDSRESHLHFEVRRSSQEGWVAENPEDFIRSQIIAE